MVAKKSGSRFTNAILIIAMSGILFITLYPYLWVVFNSFSEGAAIAAGKVVFLPVGFNLSSYRMVLDQYLFWRGYINTLIYSVSGTALALVMTTLCAYPLSKKRLVGRDGITKFMLVTMFFNGGIIPTYILIRSLGMIDTIWSIIMPACINTYYMIIMRTFFLSIPEELEEAAMIDGMGQFHILLKIFIPLSKTIMATMVLFYGVLKWNAWFKPLMFIVTPEKMPVALYLRNVVVGLQLAMEEPSTDVGALTQIYMTIKPAAIVLVSLPLLCIYPFVQKYFVRGVMIGSVKG